MDAGLQPTSASTKGGWITFPFLIATMGCLTIAAGGWTSNLIVYLINEFNVKNIDAAQIATIVNGCMTLFPIIGAILADSFFGSYLVILISSFVSLLGILLLTSTSMLNSLRPTPCDHNGSGLCIGPSKAQLAILYTSLALPCIGVAGTRFTLATMGADQFDNPKHQGVFFNWFFCTMYIGTLVSVVGIVYIEDNVSWVLGYSLSVAANLVGLAVFMLGRRYYRLLKPQGSPFTGLACVLVAAFRKRKVSLSLKSEDYCQKPELGETKFMGVTPTNSFKFLNHAALVTEGDTNSDGSIKKPWNLCTLQQVEDLKSIIRISPIWTTGILLHTPIACQMSLIVLQALAMDRHMGPHFQLSAGTMMVFVMISTSLSLAIIDRFLLPTFQKLTGTLPTPLRRIGVGHALTVASMAISALVESKRLSTARTHNLSGNSVVPMSAFWMVPQLVVVGVGEAFMFPGQVSLYYQEFPKSLKSTAAAMVSMLIGIAFYLSSAVVDFIRNTTGWLPDGINDGRMDNVYWAFTIVGLINFGYFLVCSWLYKYQNLEKEELTNSNNPF
uniref:protein NRT1/ PTR FAMILY 2.7-like n=1 Tax=Erigeron canadensis TaxID=72917 RepID=UPI001CB98E24|nr:protein NRT1/ PTR FAMILY 2.7-like [Erigeron canadensis]